MQTPILQFGTSRFLQAHADLFISDAMAGGTALGPVTVVQSSGAAERSGRLAALAVPDGFVVRVQGLVAGQACQDEVRVTSIKRALSTASDWPEVVRIAVHEARIILSNTGDGGWKPQPQDLHAQFDQAMSFPAKLTCLLAARFRAGADPIQVMPTELVPRNGAALRSRVLELAPLHGAAFAAWVEQEVLFVNSLVDRIVSVPLEPAGAVAEPYALWAIEDQPGLILPCRHPAVQVVARLDPIERLKLHILNLSHTWLAADWLDRGRPDFVREAMSDRTINDGLRTILVQEVLPVFAQFGAGEVAQGFVATTLERFANPFLDHRLADIAENHAEKVRRRIGGLIDWSESGPDAPPLPRLRAMLSLVA